VPEPQVLVAEVVVRSPEGELSEELQNEVYRATCTQPDERQPVPNCKKISTRSLRRAFLRCPRPTRGYPLGVRVTFVVQPNPVLRDVQVQANAGINVPSVLPERVVDEIFREQYGSIPNLRRFQSGIQRLNKWYQDNGYVLAQVIDAPQVTADGTVNLSVAEGGKTFKSISQQGR